MSIEAVAWALRQTVGDNTRKMILIGICNHAHADGSVAFPSIKTLSGYADCSIRTVQRHLRVLEEEKFLARGDQRLVAHLPVNRRPVVYDVVLDRGVTDVTPDEGLGCHPARSWGDTAMSYKPSLNRPEVEVLRTSTRTPRKRNEIWDALTDHFGEPKTRTEQTRRGKVVSELTAAGATPEEVHVAFRRHGALWRGIVVTEMSLLSHWTELTRGTVKEKSFWEDDGFVSTLEGPL